MNIKKILGTVVLALSPSIWAATQTITANPSSINNTVAGEFSFEVKHTTDDTANLTGLGLRIYYDSSVITFVENTSVLTTNNISHNDSGQDDTNNEDGNSDTDKYIGYSWASVSGNWNISASETLANVKFTWKGDSSKPSTTVVFKDTSHAAGYTTVLNNLTINGPFTGNPAVASSSTVMLNTSNAISQGKVATWTISLKDASGNATTNLDGKILSSNLSNATLTFGNIANDGTLTATYNYQESDFGTYNFQFKLGANPIGVSQTLTVNDPPINNTVQAISIFENTTNILTVSATDTNLSNGDILTFSLIDGADKAKFSITNSGVLTFNNAPNYENPIDSGNNNTYIATIKVTDSLGASTEKTLTVTINNVLEHSIDIFGQSRNIKENSVINANVGDRIATNGIPSTYEITSGNTTLFAINHSGQITAKSSFDFEKDITQYPLTIKITKNDAAPKSAVVTVNVTNVDEAPTIVGGATRAIKIVTGRTAVTNIHASDVDAGQIPSLSLSDSSLFTLVGNALSFNTAQIFDNTTPSNNFKTITVTASSGGKSISQTITVETIDFIDTDNDGIADEWERRQFGNLTTADDDSDVDGDGVSDKDEFIANTDPNVDNIAPVFASISKATLNAKGRKTGFALSDFKVSATDAKDGDIVLVVNLVDGKNPKILGGKLILESGSHTLTWKATDVAGNIETDTQTVDIVPVVNFAYAQMGSEGQTVVAKVSLSGKAASYPVVINFNISGADTTDYTATNTITIASGISGEAQIQLISDGISNEGDEVITLTMTNTSNAIKGKNVSHRITILETNKAPRIRKFMVEQGNIKGRIITATNNDVVISADAFDPNGDTLTYTWAVDNAVIANPNPNATTFTFNPNGTDLKGIAIRLLLSDGKADAVERSLHLRVVTPIIHNNTDDTDGDGVLDKDEAGDNDGNGIPDYKEDKDHTENTLTSGVNTVIIAQTGVRISAGKMTDGSAKLTKARMQAYLQENGKIDNTEDSGYTTGDIYDYTIDNIEEIGGTTAVIIELETAIPNAAILRKHSINNGWKMFVEDAKNIISSKIGACSDDTWSAGLIQNATCLKLIIEDGGENDADGTDGNGMGKKNGSIEDPIAISTPSSSPSGSGGSGGGCVYNPNAPARFDMVLVLLMILSIYYLIRRKRILGH